MVEDREPFLEIEGKLQNDVNGTYRKEVRECLSGHLVRVRQAMDAGMTPDEFEKANKLKAAIETSENVLDQIWRRMHG